MRWSLYITLSTLTLNFPAKYSARQFYLEVVNNSVPKYLVADGPSVLIHFLSLCFSCSGSALGSSLAPQCCGGCFVLGVCAKWVAHVSCKLVCCLPSGKTHPQLHTLLSLSLWPWVAVTWDPDLGEWVSCRVTSLLSNIHRLCWHVADDIHRHVAVIPCGTSNFPCFIWLISLPFTSDFY